MSATLVGRNDPCWCGSGRKYKKCHIDTARAARPHSGAIRHVREKALDAQYCMHPLAKQQCNGRGISAHSVSRAQSLKRVAESGHVLCITGQPDATDDQLVVAKRVGINEASTLGGFCAQHDRQLFDVIDRTADVATLEQAFLHAYRIVVRELHIKRAGSKCHDLLHEYERGLEPEHQAELHGMIKRSEFATKKGEADFEAFKRQYDGWLLTDDYTHMNALVMKCDGAPPFVCSTTAYPLHDFQGGALQSFSVQDQCELVTAHMLADDGGGTFLLAWHRQRNRVGERLAASLMAVPPEQRTEAIVRCVFTLSENVFISPPWWRELPSAAQDWLYERYLIGIDRHQESGDLMSRGTNPWVARVHDPVRLGSWAN